MSTSRIESRQNSRFKLWKEWSIHPERQECPWLPVENRKVALELARTRPIRTLLCSEPEDPRLEPLRRGALETQVIDDKLLRQISAVRSFQGFVAFFEKPEWNWEDLPPNILCVWKLQDPGNLGTLLRTAHATGCGVVCGPGGVSCFNGKVVRASASALFSTPFLEGKRLAEVKARGWRLVAATPDQGESLFEAELRPPLALIVGNEGAGLEAEALDLAEQRIHVPMAPGCQSLNAAVAGALLLYEVFRRAAAQAADGVPVPGQT